jgi:hypothetical protein
MRAAARSRKLPASSRLPTSSRNAAAMRQQPLLDRRLGAAEHVRSALGRGSGQLEQAGLGPERVEALGQRGVALQLMRLASELLGDPASRNLVVRRSCQHAGDPGDGRLRGPGSSGAPAKTEGQSRARDMRRRPSSDRALGRAERTITRATPPIGSSASAKDVATKAAVRLRVPPSDIQGSALRRHARSGIIRPR